MNKNEVLGEAREIISRSIIDCGKKFIDIDIFQPSIIFMKNLLSKDYLKLEFNLDDTEILIFHNSTDDYTFNGDVRYTCFLTRVPKVLEYVLAHEKIKPLIAQIKKRKEEVIPVP